MASSGLYHTASVSVMISFAGYLSSINGVCTLAIVNVVVVAICTISGSIPVTSTYSSVLVTTLIFIFVIPLISTNAFIVSYSTSTCTGSINADLSIGISIIGSIIFNIVIRVFIFISYCLLISNFLLILLRTY